MLFQRIDQGDDRLGGIGLISLGPGQIIGCGGAVWHQGQVNLEQALGNGVFLDPDHQPREIGIGSRRLRAKIDRSLIGLNRAGMVFELFAGMSQYVPGPAKARFAIYGILRQGPSLIGLAKAQKLNGLANKIFGRRPFGRFLQSLDHERRFVTPAMMGGPDQVFAAYGLQLLTMRAGEKASPLPDARLSGPIGTNRCIDSGANPLGRKYA